MSATESSTPPKGEVITRQWNDSTVYPGTRREFWIYVPVQYDPESPACLMVFLDGGAYVHEQGPVSVPTVFDELIHRGEMPVTIGVFISTGEYENGESSRYTEYVSSPVDYARFLKTEILTEVEKDFSLTDDVNGRAICGMSDGGYCAFAVAWEDQGSFSKVVSHIGSFVRAAAAGFDYAHQIRQTRGDPRPLRVFLQDGENDLNLNEGNWTLANMTMASALQFSRYDHRFELGPGGHDLAHGGEIFPDTLKWLWRDHPDIVSADNLPDFKRVSGAWELSINYFGHVTTMDLNLTINNSALAAELRDKQGDLEVLQVDFNNYLLRFDYVPSETQANWGKGPNRQMSAWLHLKKDGLGGVVTGISDAETKYDYAMTGKRPTIEE